MDGHILQELLDPVVEKQSHWRNFKQAIFMKPDSSPGMLMGILALACLVLLLVYLRKGLARTGWTSSLQNKIYFTTLSVLAAWVLVVGVLSLKGVFADFSTLPPRPVLLIFLPLPFIVWMAFSGRFARLALSTPEHWLIYFQSFRILVEFVLWQAFIKGLLPEQMSFEGRNWDILSGILALVVGWMVQHRKSHYRTAAVLYNITGLVLLLNVLIIALLSMPTPLRRFMNEPSVEKVAHFPMIYLPSVLVILAYSFHLFSLRQLWLKNKADLTSASEAVAEAPAKEKPSAFRS